MGGCDSTTCWPHAQLFWHLPRVEAAAISIPDSGIAPGSGNPHAPAPPTSTSAPSASPNPTTSASPEPGGATAPPPTQHVVAGIPSTTGRIGLLQVFDYHGGRIPASQIDKLGRRYDAVWGSVEATAWAHAHPGMIVSNYFIMGMDQYSVTHHTLAWWEANHPSWILYACSAGGGATRNIAYMPGISVPDVPLDIHNPQVVTYQIDTMAAAARAAGYNALAIDQFVFWNTYGGGNTALGEHRSSGEYGCGVWNGGTFVRRYAAQSDPQWTTDVIGYARIARSILHARGMSLIINHPGGSVKNPAEQQLLQNTDEVMDETGFSDYGKYQQNDGNLFIGTLAYMRYAQQHGVGVLMVNKFINLTDVTGVPLEYSIATYLLGNQGAALLFAGGAHYGTLQYHPEYDAPVGKPCSDVSGGPAVFTRRFTGGMAVVNAGLAANRLALPAGKSYRDIEGRPVSNPLMLEPNDGRVLLTSSGGC